MNYETKRKAEELRRDKELLEKIKRGEKITKEDLKNQGGLKTIFPRGQRHE